MGLANFCNTAIQEGGLRGKLAFTILNFKESHASHHELISGQKLTFSHILSRQIFVDFMFSLVFTPFKAVDYEISLVPADSLILRVNIIIAIERGFKRLLH